MADDKRDPETTDIDSGKTTDTERVKNVTDKDGDEKAANPKDKKGTDDSVNAASVPPEKLSDAMVDENLLKKRGFLLTMPADNDQEGLLDREIKNIISRYQEQIQSFQNIHAEKIQFASEQLDTLTERKQSLKEKQKEYRVQVNSLTGENESLQEQILVLHTEISHALAALGHAKETIVKTSLEAIRDELEKTMLINRNMQNEQNEELARKYQNEERSYVEKISFWKQILTKHQEHYDKVSDRLKLLARDGINSQTAQFLLYLGGLAALVSGWWFSLWTNSQNLQVHSVEGKTSTKFFFLDNIGKFLSGYNLFAMIGIILGYLIAVGVVSWACHWLLLRFGFIVDVAKMKQRKDKVSDEKGDSFELDIEDQENLLHAKIRSTEWWGLWLKITPVVLAILPLLGVISHQLTSEMGKSKDNSPDSFQGLFDSLVNEFMGTAIAIIFSVFTILFLTRIAENKYHNRDQKPNSDDSKWKLNIQYVGFVFFALMIISMIIYIYPALHGDDIREVAIFGFVVSCLATGFSLGYGYIFNGLKNNSDMLIFYIDAITSIIHNLSRPFHVNYTTNWSLRLRIYQLQQKMFDLIDGRQVLASDISSGNVSPNIKPGTITVIKTQSTPTENTGDAGANEIEKKSGKSKKGKKMGERVKKLYNWIFSKVLKREGDKENSCEAFLDDHAVSYTDLQYFPEIAVRLKQLHHQLQEIQIRRSEIKQEQRDVWVNEGVWLSIDNQIKAIENEIILLKQKTDQMQLAEIVEIAKLKEMADKEVTLLKEGYYTGLWFRDMDRGNHMILTT